MRGISLFALVLCVSLSPAEDAYSLPAAGSGDYDAVVVLLRDGLLPGEPWEGLSDSQREEFWSLGFRGILIQRIAWAGYVISGPIGSTGKLLEFARSLAEPELVPDESLPGQLLDMVPVSGCGPAVLLFTDACDPHWPPESLPLRMSAWLSSGPDTLIRTGEWSNSVFLLTRDVERVEVGSSGWNGMEYQPVPLALGSATLLVAPVTGGTPSDIGTISFQPHSCDTVFRDPWMAILGKMDEIVRELAPPVYPGDNLIWLRGAGSDGEIDLWPTVPSPAPPARAGYRVDMPEISGIPWNPGAPTEGLFPHITSLEFPGRAPDSAMAMISACIIERMIGRDHSLLPPSAEYFAVEPADDGRLILSVVWSGDLQPEANIMNDVTAGLAPLLLSIHDDVLVNNATVRASVRLGRTLGAPGSYFLSRELGLILGLL
jgi:hypothetical protein